MGFIKIRGKFEETNKQRFASIGSFIFLPLSFLIITSANPTENYVVGDYRICSQQHAKQVSRDSVQPVCYLNISSLQHLPAVIKDVSMAINESGFIKELMNHKGLTIYLSDAPWNSTDISAAVEYRAYDSVYQVKLNRLNRQATDMALATTLIHETMHCILLSVNDRARRHESEAVSTVLNLGMRLSDASKDFDFNFFGLMNKGDAGHHELMYQLFYPEMISILERFCDLHNTDLSVPRNTEFLVWSGLQYTDAYKKLTNKEKRNIENIILTAKGIDVEEN